MRDYGKVHSTFWSSPTTGVLSDDGKLLALYLMTCGHGTIAGVFRLPDGYISEDLGEAWPQDRVARVFEELAAAGWARRCLVTKWAWIVKHLEWNKPENPNQRTAARKVALTVPESCAWRVEFLTRCAPLIDLSEEQLALIVGGKQEPSANGSRKGSTTVIQLLPQEQKQKQEQKQEGSSDPPEAGSEPPSGFALPLNDGTEWAVPAKSIAEWKLAFPAVDVEQELRAMRVWGNANPTKRKTRRGVAGHIVRWLQKAQDTPSRAKQAPARGDDWTGSAT